MPCYHPLHGFRASHVNATGKRSIVFSPRSGFRDLPVTVPCGRCIGCRLERSRQWALRCMHEASLHDENVFLTLTYDDVHLPAGRTLVKKHFQDFMKRLRRFMNGEKIKYFHCGEYGEQTRRPHYHACVFGVDFPDKTFFKEKNGHKLFRSPTLERLWTHGSALIGAVTFESAAYVARYILAKRTGPTAAKHYEVVDLDTGEIGNLLPEYVTMSLKPAIAKEWYAQFKKEVRDSDSVVARGMEMKPPKYYDKLFEIEDPQAHAAMKHERRKKAGTLKNRANSTDERLRIREEVKHAQVAQLPREIE